MNLELLSLVPPVIDSSYHSLSSCRLIARVHFCSLLGQQCDRTALAIYRHLPSQQSTLLVARQRYPLPATIDLVAAEGPWPVPDFNEPGVARTRRPALLETVHPGTQGASGAGCRLTRRTQILQQTLYVCNILNHQVSPSLRLHAQRCMLYFQQHNFPV